MRPWVRRARVVLLVVGLLLVLAVGTAWILFQLHGPELARTQLEQALSAALGRPARVGAVTFRPWTATLRVSGVRVASDDPTDGGALVALDHADVGIRLESLWRRRLVLSLALTGLDVRTAGTGEGGAGLAAFAFPATLSLGAVDARVGLVRLAKGHLQHRDPGGSLAYEVSGLEAEAWPEPPALRLSARAESLRLETPAGEERAEQLRVAGSVGPGEIRLERSRFRWYGEELRLSGHLMQPVPGAEARATLRAELPLAAAGRRAGLGDALAGLATVEATLEGLWDAPRVEARVTVPELGAGPVRARDVRLAGSFVDGTLRVSDLRAELPGGAVGGALTVSRAAADGVRIAELTVDGLRLPRALAALGPGAVRATARLGSGRIELGPASARWAHAQFDVAGQLGRGAPLALHAELDADLGGLGAAGGATPVAGRVAVSADATGTLERPVVTGRVEARSLAIGTRPVGPVELRVRLEAAGGLSRWTGTLDAGRVAAPPASVEELRAGFTLDADALDVQRLTGRVAGIPLELRGRWTWAGAGRAEADVGPVVLGQRSELPTELALAGTGAGRVELTMGERTEVTAAVDLTGISLHGVALGTGQLNATLRERDLTAEVAFPAMRVSAAAKGRLEGGHVLAAQARVERLDLDPIVARLAPDARPYVRAALSARAEAEIPVDRPETARATAWLTPDELVVGGERWTARSAAVVRWESERLSLDPVELRGPRGTLRAEGGVDRRSGDGRVAVGLEDARLPPPFDGLGRGVVRGEARLTRAALEGVAVRARWPTWALTADGRIPFEAAMVLRSELTADVAELARVQGVAGVAGQAQVSADITGPWREPVASGRLEAPILTIAGQTLTQVRVPFQLTPSTLHVEQARALLGADPLAVDGGATRAGGGWRGQGTLSAPSVTLGQWPIQSARAVFTVDPERLAVTELALGAHGIPVRGTAVWPWRGPGRLEARLGPAALARVPGIPPAVALEGTASGRVEATGRSLADATARASLGLEQVQAVGVRLGAGTVEVDLRGGAARAQIRFPDRRLAATAEGRVAADAIASVRASVDELALGELAPHLGLGAAPSIEGTLSARIQAEVPLARPTASRGTLRVDPLRAVVAGESVTSREPIVAVFDATGVRVERFVLQGSAGAVTGRLGVERGGRLDAALRGQIQLGLLGGLRPELEETSGTLDVTATVAGTTAAPVFDGEGTVRGGRIRLKGVAEPVHEIEAHVTASRAGLRLTQARGQFGGGTVSATGEAALTNGALGAYRAELTARRVGVSPMEGLSTLWDGELAVTGRGARGQVGGELRLLRGNYTRELAPASKGPAPAASAGPTGPGLPLRVLVRLDDNLIVRNRTARLRVGGTLSIEGTTAAPAVLGTLESREGMVAFRNRRFTIVSATARFLDPRRIEPFLNAVATASIREYDVTVRVSGRLDSLDVSLRSIPPLSQEDLLALVAFGATRAELQRSPAGVLAWEATGTIVRDLLGLDSLDGESRLAGAAARFQVGPAPPGQTTPGELRSSETGTGQRVRVEYRLLGPVSLVGEQGQQGGYAAGVVLRLRFR
jgi:autotransporter translocation and assembly factor TamB